MGGYGPKLATCHLVHSDSVQCERVCVCVLRLGFHKLIPIEYPLDHQRHF